MENVPGRGGDIAISRVLYSGALGDMWEYCGGLYPVETACAGGGGAVRLGTFPVEL